MLVFTDENYRVQLAKPSAFALNNKPSAADRDEHANNFAKFTVGNIQFYYIDKV